MTALPMLLRHEGSLELARQCVIGLKLARSTIALRAWRSRGQRSCHLGHESSWSDICGYSLGGLKLHRRDSPKSTSFLYSVPEP